MASTTAIEWTDSTVNFWWGCTKVGPGCDHCYAETFANRFPKSQGKWGTGAPRLKIESAADTLAKLNRQHTKFFATHGSRRRVFIESMSDLFDNEVHADWFDQAWNEIIEARNIDTQIVTKRISTVEKRLSLHSALGRKWPQHVGLIITVCTQAEADRDVPRLLALKAKFNIPWVGLSIEPLLQNILIEEWLWSHDQQSDDDKPTRMITLDWIIVGGESGPNARPMHPDWARSLRDQCSAANVPFFFKQWGEWVPDTGPLKDGEDPVLLGCRAASLNAAGAWVHYASGYDVPNYTIDLSLVYRVGKAAAGRLLEGIEHNAMPRT